MRRIIASGFSLLLLASPAFAGDTSKISCRAYAQAIADEWSAGELERADFNAPLDDPDRVLIVAAGESYLVPRQQSGKVKSVGTLIREHKRIYAEEFRRCIRGGKITINVDGELKQD